ncbi:hypothetical protein AAMO2058_001599500 [Amorphochlora amoebiformis]
MEEKFLPEAKTMRKQEQNLLLPTLSAVGACLGAFMFGYSLGFTSPALSAMQGEVKNQVFTDIDCNGDTVSSGNASLFSSIVSIGAMIGALAGKTSDVIGRKKALTLASIPFMAGYAWLSVTTSAEQAIVSRVVSGMGVGLSSVIVPVYIAEISPDAYRGLLGTLNQLGVVIGIFGVYLIGALLPHNQTTYANCSDANTSTVGENWNKLAWIGFAVSAMLFVVSFFLPESPIYLHKCGEREKAKAVMRRLWGSQFDTDLALRNLGSVQGSEDPVVNTVSEGPSVWDLFSPEMRKPMIVGSGILIFQQLGGINAVIFFSSDIFKSAGVTDSDASGLYVMSVQVVVTFLSIFLVERLGRRTLLLSSTAGMAVMAGLLAIFFILKSAGNEQNWLALFSLMAYCLSFSLGLGPVSWLLVSEILPDKTRALAVSFCTMLNWTCAFLVTETFLYVEKALKPYGAFILYGAICCVATMFTYFFVFETKGLSVEEIQIRFKTRSSTVIDPAEEYLTANV